LPYEHVGCVVTCLVVGNSMLFAGGIVPFDAPVTTATLVDQPFSL
jgi:hypothetical protein